MAYHQISVMTYSMFLKLPALCVYRSSATRLMNASEIVTSGTLLTRILRGLKCNLRQCFPRLYRMFGVCGVVLKNCPKALQGIMVGKDGKPSVRMEVICSLELWIWYFQFGLPGALYDLNIPACS